MGGSSSPDSSPPTSSKASGSSDASDTYEKWLVRILLTLAFGLAFGIEGMTLLRSYLFYGEEATPNAEQTSEVPVLREGEVLVPSLAPSIRVRRLRVQATDQAWTFTLVADPDTARDRPVTLSFDRLTTSDGTTHTTAPTYTWAPPDTAAVTAAWSLAVGQRPDALTVTATVRVSPDSTVSTTRTMDVGHVPVRMQ